MYIYIRLVRENIFDEKSVENEIVIAVVFCQRI